MTSLTQSDRKINFPWLRVVNQGLASPHFKSRQALSGGQLTMNLHPSISMYYESNLNRWFLHQKPQPQNIYNYSSLPRNVINNVYFEYKNKRLSFEKVHTIMTATNDCLRESMHSNKIIGDKQPLFQFDAGNDLPYVEYLASLPNSHFIILYRRDFKKYIDSVINWVRGDFPKKKKEKSYPK